MKADFARWPDHAQLLRPGVVHGHLASCFGDGGGKRQRVISATPIETQNFARGKDVFEVSMLALESAPLCVWCQRKTKSNTTVAGVSPNKDTCLQNVDGGERLDGRSCGPRSGQLSLNTLPGGFRPPGSPRSRPLRRVWCRPGQAYR